MNCYLLLLIFSLFLWGLKAQQPVVWAGNYKIRFDGVDYSISVKEKDGNLTALITSKGNYTYYNKYSCSCTIKENWFRANEHWMNCYMIELLEGKNIMNPKPGEFLFSIVSSGANFYPFFRGFQPPNKFDKTTPKLIKLK